MNCYNRGKRRRNNGRVNVATYMTSRDPPFNLQAVSGHFPAMPEHSAACQGRWQSVAAVGSLSRPSAVCHSHRESVRDVGSLSQPSAVCQRGKGSVRDVGSLSQPSAVRQKSHYIIKCKNFVHFVSPEWET